MLFCSISRKQSSSGLSVVTATSSRVMISEVFIQAGHLFSAATLSDTSLCEITPVSFPLAFITPTERTCFSRRYCAAWCTLVSSVMEKTSFRRSEEHTSELQSQSNLVCRLLLEKKNYHGIASLIDILQALSFQSYSDFVQPVISTYS